MFNESSTQMIEELKFAEFLKLTTAIVSSYVSHNKVSAEEIPHVINIVYQLLSKCDKAPTYCQQPAVPVHESISDDYIVCLEDGKKLKMLKHHLRSVHNMTIVQYREKWNLSPGYRMVAPKFADKRSSIALQIGLGSSRKRASASA